MKAAWERLTNEDIHGFYNKPWIGDLIKSRRLQELERNMKRDKPRRN